MRSTSTEADSDSLSIQLAEPEHMAEWDEYVAKHPSASLYHLSGWRRVISQVFGRQAYYLFARSNGAMVGVLPVIRLKSFVFGDFLVSLPYLNYGGILADSPAVAERLVEHCSTLSQELGVRHVELRHTTNDLDLPARTDKICMHLDLPADPDELWRQFGSKLRAQIRRPQRESAESVVGGSELIDDFYPIFARKYRDLGVPVYPKRWFESVLLEFRDYASVYVVRIAGQPVAAGIVLRFRETAEVVWAASVREADRLGANMFLYWSMLEGAVLGGMRVFDFGRTTEGSGTHRFKKQWGARPVQLYWHYILGTSTEIPQLNLDNPKYHAAAAVWRRLPVWVTNIVGPSLVRNLP